MIITTIYLRFIKLRDELRDVYYSDLFNLMIFKQIRIKVKDKRIYKDKSD